MRTDGDLFEGTLEKVESFWWENFFHMINGDIGILMKRLKCRFEGIFL